MKVMNHMTHQDRKAPPKRVRIGRRVVGFMCIRSEPYPWGESECLPMYGGMELLPDEPDGEAKVISPKDSVAQAIEAVRETSQKRGE